MGEPPGQLRPADDQVRLAEQIGGPQGEQAGIAWAGADESHQARPDLRKRAGRARLGAGRRTMGVLHNGCEIHYASSPTLVTAEPATIVPAPCRSSSAATSRPSLSASAAAPDCHART